MTSNLLRGKGLARSMQMTQRPNAYRLTRFGWWVSTYLYIIKTHIMLPINIKFENNIN